MPSWFTVVYAMFPLLWMLFNNFGFTAAVSHSRNSASSDHKINPKPCSVNGLEGTCMFVWECINTEGHHIGMCVDTFMFGSCCAHNLTTSQILQIPDSSEPAILYTQPASGQRPSASNRPSRPRPKPSTTARPALYLPNHNDIDRVSSSNGRPVHNQIRPNVNYNDVNNMYNSIDKSDVNNWSSSQKPSHAPFPTPSQHFQNSLPDRVNVYSKPNQSTSQPSTKLPTLSWITTNSTEATLQTAASNLRPNFVSRPTILSTVLPVQHRQNSSHFSSTNTPTSTASSTTVDNWNNQNWESNEIDDVSNHIDSNNNYQYRPHWHSSTQQPFMTWTKPSSKPPPFVTKPKPWYLLTNKYPQTESTTTHKYHPHRPFTSSTSSTTTTTTTTPAPTTTPMITTSTMKTTSHSTMTLVSASTSDKKTQCGVSPLTPPRHDIRIVGGRNAQFGVWAWQVSVRRTSFFGFSSTHRCGGALLNENWIATAGHCVDDLLTSQIKIRVGEYDFSSIQEPYPFAERGVARKVVHPKYNFFTYEYDLAMVRLDSPLEYAPHIVPICLPGSDDLLIGENATVTGWGRLSEGGTLPSVLQEVSVPIVSNDKCKNMFLRAGRHEYIPDIFMCAGFDSGGRDSCQGDSGGPLQVKGKDGRYFLAGIISWGIGCAEANLPGVCTRISKFVPWILQTVT
ncbi:serine proteinase stubble-like isoform X2 [Planococcus citri]|uniref:serine proteinase stubble-like isoform X2 n=1 Tax=Planococcus citri TaxID=170843 RepID=UPI0031F918D3